MKRLILILSVLLASCASSGDLSDWPTRYRAEVGALTKAYVAATVGLMSGAVSRESAAKVLDETDKLAAQLALVTVLRPAVEGSADLVKAQAAAREGLAAALR